MWLAYGRNDRDEFIHVSEVKRGKSALRCPYCGGTLTAKKGRVKAHHFAHSSETCQGSSHYDFYDITREDFPLDLSAYDYAIQRRQEIEAEREKLQTDIAELSAKVERGDRLIADALQLLEKISQPYKNGARPKNRQANFEVLEQLRAFLAKTRRDYPEFQRVRHSSFSHYFAFDLVGRSQRQIAIGRTAYYSRELWEYRDKLFVPEPLADCLNVLDDYLQNKSRLTQLQADLSSFDREQERFQRFTLYFLKIRTGSATYHKIGITGRKVEERLKEIEQEVRKFGRVKVSIEHQIVGYAFLENFFKHKYADYRLDFDTHSEYFQLPAAALQEILENLERLEYLSLDRIGKLKAGMQKAKARGKHIGRPAREEKAEAFLRKPKSQEIAALLDQGLGIREIQRQTGYSINTVRKVKTLRKQK